MVCKKLNDKRRVPYNLWVIFVGMIIMSVFFLGAGFLGILANKSIADYNVWVKECSDNDEKEMVECTYTKSTLEEIGYESDKPWQFSFITILLGFLSAALILCGIFLTAGFIDKYWWYKGEVI